MQVFKIIVLTTLLLVSIQAQKVALLVETEGGAPLHTDKDIVTMKSI